MQRATNPEVAVVANTAPFDGPIVRVTALRKSYGTNEVLKGIDLDVKRGEVIAIIGKSERARRVPGRLAARRRQTTAV